jgi:hypothetical protein
VGSAFIDFVGVLKMQVLFDTVDCINGVGMYALERDKVGATLFWLFVVVNDILFAQNRLV